MIQFYTILVLVKQADESNDKKIAIEEAEEIIHN